MSPFLNADAFRASEFAARRISRSMITGVVNSGIQWKTVMRSNAYDRFNYDLGTCEWMHMVECGWTKTDSTVAAFEERFLSMCEWYGVTDAEPTVADLRKAVLDQMAMATAQGIYNDVEA